MASFTIPLAQQVSLREESTPSATGSEFLICDSYPFAGRNDD
jgi:hypothetical protein